MPGKLMDTDKTFDQIIENVDLLISTLQKYNEAYRNGNPLVTDREYDYLVEKLRDIEPEHFFLKSVEPENFDTKIEIRHPFPMLSTEKAYAKKDLERFFNRVKKEAGEIGIIDVQFKVTPKLDGLAGRDDGKIFASRGNGETGYEISSAFRKGILPFGGRGLGLGEIVIKESYFQKHLADEFEHPRNMVVGIVTSDKLNDHAKKALKNKAVLFVPYTMLETHVSDAESLLENMDDITKELQSRVDFPMDGVVVEAVDESVKKYMGATAHHYRWQIAVKTKGETARTNVIDILWQVGRTGNITPVLLVESVNLSGANIGRVTAHNAGLVKAQKIGIGSAIEIIRSGEVIPKIEKVLTQADDWNSIKPAACPSCNELLIWENDFLKCTNPACKAQIEQSISHWFKTLANVDWFGIKTIQKLVDNGYNSLEKIYRMVKEDFINAGFGPVQSQNLFNALELSISKPVDDWRFLAAFGISDLGKGDSRKLLSHIRLEEILTTSAVEIQKIHGFGTITSNSIEKGINKIHSLFMHMLSLNFNLSRTLLLTEIQPGDNPLSGKGIVFTGKMLHGTREQMQKKARDLGAIVQTSISRKTNFLVCGENVGKKKIEKAESYETRILNEKEFFDLAES